MTFEGGEIVRLVQDSPAYGLQAGDCGVLWGIQAFTPTLYQALFHRSDGTDVNLSFYAEDIALAVSADQMPCPAWIEQTQRQFRAADTELHQQQDEEIRHMFKKRRPEG